MPRKKPIPKPAELRRAVIWAGVSTLAQARKDSTRQQIEDGQRVAEVNGWTIADIIEIPGHSRDYLDLADAAHDMPGYARLVQHLEDQDFEVFVFRDSDRIGRTQALVARICEELHQLHIDGYSLTAGHIPWPYWRMHIALGGYKSASEIDELRRRHRDGMPGRVARGLHPGNVPMGWEILRDNRGRTRGYRFRDEWVPFYRTLEQMFLRGVGYRRIAGTLTQQYRNDGKAWWPYAIRMLVSNPWTYGHAQLTIAGETMIKRDVHPTAWEDPTAMRQEIARRKALRGAARKQLRRFSGGLLRCANCGAAMIANSRRYYSGQRVLVYRCPTRGDYRVGLTDKSCTNNVIREHCLIEQLGEWFREAAANPEAVEAYIAGRQSPDTLALQAEHDRLTRRATEIETELANLAEHLSQVPAGAVQAVLATMRSKAEEKEQIRDRLGQLEEQLATSADPETIRAEIQRRADNFDKLIRQAPPAQVQAELHRIFGSIYAWKGQITLGA